MKLKIKKGDTVKVIAGKDKDKTGRVLVVYPDKMRILVEGVNVATKHEKPNANNQQGGRVERELPLHYSNVQLLDSDGKASRIGIKLNESNGVVTKERYAKSNGKTI